MPFRELLAPIEQVAKQFLLFGASEAVRFLVNLLNVSSSKRSRPAKAGALLARTGVDPPPAFCSACMDSNCVLSRESALVSFPGKLRAVRRSMAWMPRSGRFSL